MSPDRTTNLKSAVHTSVPSRGALESGLSSEIESVPTGFVHRTLLLFGDAGVTAGMEAWGRTIQALKYSGFDLVLGPAFLRSLPPTPSPPCFCRVLCITLCDTAC